MERKENKPFIPKYSRDFKRKRKEYEREYYSSKLKAEFKDREGRRGFFKAHRMHKYPLMADVFDFLEGLRAEPNGRTPFMDEVKVDRDIVYKSVDGENLVLDIYYPPRPIAGKSPAVMYIPGGGWMIHNRKRRDGEARCLAVMGAVVAVIEHRLCPLSETGKDIVFPQNLADCVDAYNYLVARADELSIDKQNITVIGDSSGGHLAACLGCAATVESYARDLTINAPITKPSGMIFISGAFSFDVMHRIPLTHKLIVRYVSGTRTRKAFRCWKYYKYANPYNFISSDFPPTYNNGGGLDIFCAGEAKRMAKILTRNGVENECCVGKNIFNNLHCYVLRMHMKSARKDMRKLLAWYVKLQQSIDVDLSVGFARVQRFFDNYKKALDGRVEV